MFEKSTTLNIQPIELQFENQIFAKNKLSIMPLKPRPNAVNQIKIGAHITEIKCMQFIHGQNEQQNN